MAPPRAGRHPGHAADEVVPATTGQRTSSRTSPRRTTRPTSRSLATSLELLPADPGLALGIGRVTDALADELAGRGDVDILTGVVTNAVRAMHGRGHTRQSADPGDVGGRISGPAALGAESGVVEIIPSTEIHEPSWLAGHDRFVIGARRAPGRRARQRQLRAYRRQAGLRPRWCPDFALRRPRQPRRTSHRRAAQHRPHGRSRLVPDIARPEHRRRQIDVVVTENGVAICGVWRRRPTLGTAANLLSHPNGARRGPRSCTPLSRSRRRWSMVDRQCCR